MDNQNSKQSSLDPAYSEVAETQEGTSGKGGVQKAVIAAIIGVCAGLAGLLAFVMMLSSRIEVAENAIDTLTLSKNEEDLSGQISALSEEISSFAEEISGLEKDMSSMDEKVQALSELSSKVSSLDTKVQALSEELQQLQEEFEAEPALPENVKITMYLCISDENGDVRDAEYGDDNTVSLSDLNEGECYVPKIYFQNNGENQIILENVSYEMTDIGKTKTWEKSFPIDPGRYHSFWTSQKELLGKTGSFQITWYVNGHKVSIFDWTVE